MKASSEALNDSGLDISESEAFRFGCSIGVGLGALHFIEIQSQD